VDAASLEADRDERLGAGSLFGATGSRFGSVFTDSVFTDSVFTGGTVTGSSVLVVTCTLPQLELRRRAVVDCSSVRVGASDGSAVVAAGVVS